MERSPSPAATGIGLPRNRSLLPIEHDACAIICLVRKGERPTHGIVKRTLDALVEMGHRSGEIDGEGDGCGLMTDIPRTIWAGHFEAAGLAPSLSRDPFLVIGHFLIAPEAREQAAEVVREVQRRLTEIGMEILLIRNGNVEPSALGRLGRQEEPLFVQIAGLLPVGSASDRALFHLSVELEQVLPLHVASLSHNTTIYKVRGSAEVLSRYYPELRSPLFTSRINIGHNRYSTNTTSRFDRVQPFSLLGHNGEINTISRLRDEARMLGISLPAGGSDSQDLNRTLEGLLFDHGLSLLEAMEVVFPPILTDVERMPADLQDLYVHYRHFFGPFAQGPVGIVSRYGGECVFSVDALGLRPLWFGETEKDFFSSSEQGIVSFEEMVTDPVPLAPGEKIALWVQQDTVTVLRQPEISREALLRSRSRGLYREGARSFLHDRGAPVNEEIAAAGHRTLPATARERLLGAFVWDQEDIKLVETMAVENREPIGSLGYDGPLAVLGRERRNLSDFFKESVAVVTNPAIDREREMEHFSTRTVLGVRPTVQQPGGMRVELHLPLLLGSHRGGPDATVYREIASSVGTWLLEDLLSAFGPQASSLSTTFQKEEGLEAALERLSREAVRLAREGSALLLLDDGDAYRDDRLPIDPHLALSAVDLALRGERDREGLSLRRHLGLVLRSGAIRNLHDLILAVGLGADAVNPYLLLEVAAGEAAESHLRQVAGVLQKGLEKVISTIGIHELRGYSRLFASIGLSADLQRYLGTPNFYGDGRGFSLAGMEREALRRYEVFREELPLAPVRTFHFLPKVYKAAQELAQTGQYAPYGEKLDALERETPISLRHLLDLRPAGEPVPVEEVDVAAGRHAYPLLISSMSFGSQNEVAFRAYAEAAARINMISLNGEGGEIKDMIGRYPLSRGQQIASGRFGVNVDLLNSSDLLEIKVGQGAKPGEGGHLPGAKVSVKVAAARNATPGVDLISPSNNHDIYSIEDLAQFITELKTANPQARVAVKVPVVPNIGTIAVGIAKAGADIIELSGFDGGTGAARQHALRHVGLPVEIGVHEAHRALVTAGLRDQVEIWADGGLRSGVDVIKMILLGANRCGFGTLAMVAIGCTACRSCQTDTCHVGIATQVETREEAAAKGMRRWTPRDPEESVERLSTFFRAIGEEVRRLTGLLGARRTQDLVGRSDLLVQTRLTDQVDLDGLLLPAYKGEKPDWHALSRPVKRPLTYLSQAISQATLSLVEKGERDVTYQDQAVSSADRALGTHLAGTLSRGRMHGDLPDIQEARLLLREGSIPGNGLAAFLTAGISVTVEGGAQDGVGKSAVGGKVVVLKGQSLSGRYLDGSIGKSFLYGAQRGLFLIQGDADSRAGIRLSGADVVIGGELANPVDDSLGNLGVRANIKGFAFEYMTGGRAVVLGDPGPWICSGMTGGVVYLRYQPELGLDDAALRRRIAKGANVRLLPTGAQDRANLEELLSLYREALIESGQLEAAARVAALLGEPERHFRKVIPRGQQASEEESTE